MCGFRLWNDFATQVPDPYPDFLDLNPECIKLGFEPRHLVLRLQPDHNRGPNQRHVRIRLAQARCIQRNLDLNSMLNSNPNPTPTLTLCLILTLTPNPNARHVSNTTVNFLGNPSYCFYDAWSDSIQCQCTWNSADGFNTILPGGDRGPLHLTLTLTLTLIRTPVPILSIFPRCVQLPTGDGVEGLVWCSRVLPLREGYLQPKALCRGLARCSFDPYADTNTDVDANRRSVNLALGHQATGYPLLAPRMSHSAR